MTTLEQLAQRPVAGTSQATAIEQTRAMEEVRAAVVVAQQCPRNVPQAIAAMRETCHQRALAERAFFRYSRAGSQVSGASVHMARELARCWGNIQYGIHELSRDDAAGQSEMFAFAWDLETNTRSSATFIVPHARDTKGGRKPIVDLRDVYENNANMGARRVREAIFSVLPAWFTEEAKDLCMATLADAKSGKTHPQQVSESVAWFASDMNVAQAQLEEKLGRSVADWTPGDLAVLRVIGKSLTRGETTVADEFPKPSPARLTAEEITGTPATADQGA